MGLLMMAVLVTLIVLGLQRNHYRRRNHLAGSQNVEDRDLDRLVAELRARR
ncbi:hypothetical protein [Actinophytocola sp.]|uniref:hypothetical protein n=1 Tax=Actinophytocola sp. TaxID=1872138 RepID=UPI003899AB69